MWWPGSLTALLIAYLLVVSLQPTRGLLSRIFFYFSLILGLTFIILHYTHTLSIGVKVGLAPFVLIESHENYKVYAFDWGQIIALLMIANTIFYYKNRRRSEYTSIQYEREESDEENDENSVKEELE